MDAATNVWKNLSDELRSPDKLLSPNTLPGAIIYGVIIFFLAWLVGRAVNLAVHRAMNRPKHFVADQTAIRFLGQLARLAVYVFAFLTYTHLVKALNGLGTAWLASVGVVSVVFGLAAQNTLGNLIAGISLLLYRPFSVGDRLQVTAPTGLETGIVENLDLGYTILRTPDNRRIVIPNSAMASQTSVNLSQTDRRTLCVVPIGISYDADVDKARRTLLNLAAQNPKVEEPAGCPVTALEGSRLVLSLKVWCANLTIAADLKSDLMEAAQKRLKAEGIEVR
jgi:small-conductance mechanosensitive channel